MTQSLQSTPVVKGPINVRAMPSNINAKAKGDEKKITVLVPDLSDTSKPSTELFYCDYFEGLADYRVGGVIDQATCETERRVYRWTDDHQGAFWRLQTEAQNRNHVSQWLRKRFPGKVKTVNAKSCVETMLDLLSFEPEQALKRDQNRKVTILPLKNAYLFIEKDGTVRAEKPNREASITHVVPAEIDWSRVDARGIYTPSSVPAESAWGSYLDLFMSNMSIRNLLQEATGASLLSTNFERGFMLVGTGSNGKSTYLNVLRAFHPLNTDLPLDKLDSEYNLAKLSKGQTLATSSENVQYIGRSGEQILKSVISRDLISAREPYEGVQCFRSKATLFWACNKPTQFSDRTKGLGTKIEIIPFLGFKNRENKGAIRDFDGVVVGDSRELAVVLDWALLGAARLRKQGDQFSKLEDEALEAAKNIKVESDPLMQYFIDVELRSETAFATSKDAIFADYEQTTIDGRNKPVSKGEFWRAAREFVQAELNGIYEEMQPAGGSRYAKRQSRVCNLTVRGIQPAVWTWKGHPVPVPSQATAPAVLTQKPVFVDAKPDPEWDEAMTDIELMF
jgi:hypothetical protein